MIISRTIMLAVLVLCFSVEVTAQDDLRARANIMFGQLPRTMPDSENDTMEQISLGEQLYFETALSANRTQSCNTCHNLLDGGAGVERLKISVG